MSASTECFQTSLKTNNCESRKLNQFISHSSSFFSPPVDCFCLFLFMLHVFEMLAILCIQHSINSTPFCRIFFFLFFFFFEIVILCILFTLCMWRALGSGVAINRTQITAKQHHWMEGRILHRCLRIRNGYSQWQYHLQWAYRTPHRVSLPIARCARNINHFSVRFCWAPVLLFFYSSDFWNTLPHTSHIILPTKPMPIVSRSRWTLLRLNIVFDPFEEYSLSV